MVLMVQSATGASERFFLNYFSWDAFIMSVHVAPTIRPIL